jgi:hypothetical protein
LAANTDPSFKSEKILTGIFSKESTMLIDKTFG